jgi:transposase InsO family protein
MAMWRFGLIAPVINGTYTAPSKMAYYRECTKDGLMMPDGTTARYSPKTLSYWECSYRRGGFEALIDRGRCDKGEPRRLSSEAASAILRLKEEFPKMNATMVLERLIADGTVNQQDVSLSTVQRFVRRATVGRAVGTAKDRKAYEAERVNGIWQADTLYGPYVKDGGRKCRAYLISVLDDKSRLVCASRFFFADNTLNFQKLFKDAIARFGLPERLYVDNGGTYASGQLAGICGALGVVLLHAPPYDGAAKGKIERWHRTLRGRFLSVLPDSATESLDALNGSLAEWVCAYNTTVHSSTGKTPMDAYRMEADGLRAPTSGEWLHGCFLNRISRKVKADATVTVNNILYDAPQAFIGCRVDICFAPDDADDIHIVCEDKAFALRRTNKADNARTRRATSPYSIDYGSRGDDDGDSTAVLPA